MGAWTSSISDTKRRSPSIAGSPEGRYADKADLSITLDEEPEDVMLVRVRDLDGDGRSDLAITRTLAPPEPGATSPARLEMMLSGAAR
jgi:hypothetical protein